jgi:hypothetical protein
MLHWIGNRLILATCAQVFVLLLLLLLPDFVHGVQAPSSQQNQQPYSGLKTEFLREVQRAAVTVVAGDSSSWDDEDIPGLAG